MKVIYVDAERFPRGLSYEKELFGANGIEFEALQASTEDELIEKCKDADGVIDCFEVFSRRVFENLPNLKVIVRTGVGYDALDIDAATDCNVAACCVPHYCSEEVALSTMAHILNCLRRVAYENRYVHEGKWQIPMDKYPFARFSKTVVGLVGFGNIARMTAKYLSGFDCRVIAYDPYLPDEVFENAGVERVTLDELIERADTISLHVPENRETHHMLNAQRFAQMKDGVTIVNCSRGPLVETEALCDALESGKVRCAGLDVLEHEPPTEAEARLLSFDNVFITPHHGAQSREAMEDLFKQSADIVLDGLHGNIPKTAVNKKALEEKRTAH